MRPAPRRPVPSRRPVGRSVLAAAGLATAVALIVTGCSGSNSGTASPSTTDSTSTGHDQAHWSYTGADGPEAWGSLSNDFAACEIGKQQSPIAIQDPKPVHRSLPSFNYTKGTAELVNNGHTVQALPGPGNVMKVDGTDYGLVQMHFHTPSENTIDGKQYAGEIHFVHESAVGKTVVFGLMLQAGAANPGWATYIDHAPTSGGASNFATVDWPRMLPGNMTTIRFPGSLSTPDCTEGLGWFVATHPVSVSAAQLQQLESIFGDNARPVQPVNGREVTIDQP